MSRPRIVVLDGYTLNPGDLDWEAIEALGDVTVYDRSGPLSAERAQGAPIVLTNKDIINAELMAQLPELRYIGVLATGTNVVDLAAARQRGIVVTNIPGYGTTSVAQHVFALLLELVNHVARYDRAVRDGAWQGCPDFCFYVDSSVELAGKKLAIVGLGAIGQQVARIGHAFGMSILAAQQRSADRVRIEGVALEWLPLDRLFAEADVVTLHCPLTEATQRMVNGARLAMMKPSAYLINTGRGPLVDEAALGNALQQGQLAGVGLDVLSVEPPRERNPLIGAPRCIITPHVAWGAREARRRLMQIAADNINAYLRGEPIHVVNG